ncbi:MAG: SPFH domain-containing protein [Phycisphaerae bacterium]
MDRTKIIIRGLLVLAVLFLLLYEGLWRWSIERTWVPPNKSLQLTRLTGSASAKDSYAGPGQQGVIEQMLGPGRHFLMPWEYQTRIVEDFEVPAGHIALVRNNVGKDLPEGRFLAEPDEKGTQRRILTPGVWRLNEFGQTPYIQPEYAAKGMSKTQPMVSIPPGYVGVQTVAETQDPSQEKGIQKTVLQAGYYTINPEKMKVTTIGVGYDVMDMHVQYEPTQITDKTGVQRTVQRPKEGTGLSFPLADGKQMYLDITVVWGIYPEDAPRIVGEYGTLEMLEEKIIIPQVLSICKNAGSDLTTRDFIAGSTRDKFQEKVTQDLQKIGKEKGIHFLIALVRGFHPDPEIAATIQAKMLAEEEMITLNAERERDTIAAELEGAKRKVATALSDFDAQTGALVAGEREEGIKGAALVKAEADRKVAALDRQVAETAAQGQRINGKAEADVLEMINRAEAELMKLKVNAYGGADHFSLIEFARTLPDDLRIEYHYAGLGTFWNNTQTLTETAAKKILSETAPLTTDKTPKK